MFYVFLHWDSQIPASLLGIINLDSHVGVFSGYACNGTDP